MKRSNKRLTPLGVILAIILIIVSIGVVWNYFIPFLAWVFMNPIKTIVIPAAVILFRAIKRIKQTKA